MRRLLPSPPLSAALFVVWLLLNQSLDLATMLMGALLAVVVPILTRSLRPAAVKMHRPGVALALVGIVLYDLVRSAWTVAKLLLTRRDSDMKPCYVRLPLELRDANALAVLSMILCLTPGTAWGEIAYDRSSLLIHMFDLDDEAMFIDMVKTRYERRLMEIFES